MKLLALEKGERARIRRVGLEGEHATLGRRLLLMGLRPGATVEMVGRSPFGEPFVVRVQKQSFGLRRELLEKIEVEPLGH